MTTTKCAICETEDNFRVLYPARLPQKIDAQVYAPRRARDFYHYQFVKCNECSLVRSNPILDEEKMKVLYQDSLSDYNAKHVEPFKKTYGRYLRTMLRNYSVDRGTILEIGCANGFLFPVIKSIGFKRIAGVEPSLDAVNGAGSEYKSLITHGFFTGTEYSPNSFDVILFFQTFDHILDPNKFLDGVCNVLKPGGLVLTINHNVGSVTARLMGEKCPIFDIGHVYLYDKNTMRKIFEKNGFLVHKSFSVRNSFSLEYIIKLLPIRQSLKDRCSYLVNKLGIRSFEFSWYMGNLGCIAQKPL